MTLFLSLKVFFLQSNLQYYLQILDLNSNVLFKNFRPEVIISDQAEDTVLMDFNPDYQGRRQRDNREAYEDDDNLQGPRGVQCATQ